MNVVYSMYNVCSTCELKLPKDKLRCPDCNQKLRTKRRNKKNGKRT